jgi:hypothetical protein
MVILMELLASLNLGILKMFLEPLKNLIVPAGMGVPFMSVRTPPENTVENEVEVAAIVEAEVELVVEVEVVATDVLLLEGGTPNRDPSPVIGDPLRYHLSVNLLLLRNRLLDRNLKNEILLNLSLLLPTKDDLRSLLRCLLRECVRNLRIGDLLRNRGQGHRIM